MAYTGTEKVARFRERRRLMLIERAGGRCVRCGYGRYAGALCFHHRDPALKKFALSRTGIQHSLEDVLAEADKCDLLCANCHAEVHAGLEAEDGALEAQPVA